MIFLTTPADKTLMICDNTKKYRHKSPMFTINNVRVEDGLAKKLKVDAD
jgi:hypothetical protein